MDKKLTAQLASFQTLTSNAEALQDRRKDTEADREVVNYIFHRIQAICPGWQYSLGHMNEHEKQQLLKTMKREWLNELMDRGINQKELIDYALKKLKEGSSPFFPKVGKFIEWCDEGRLPVGTKKEAESYIEIQKYSCQPRESREPSTLSPETYHTFSVICDIGEMDILNIWDRTKALECWSKHHRETLQLLKDGKTLKIAPPPAEKLEHLHVPAKPKTVSEAFISMRKGLK